MRVLFLCTGNSARSPMAAALLRTRAGGVIEVTSAGSHPRPLHPNALKVMAEEHGIDLSGHTPTGLGEVADQRFDRVISLCDRVREVCPEWPGDPEAIHWSLANPANGETDAITYPLFRQTAAELADRVEFLLAALADEDFGRSR